MERRSGLLGTALFWVLVGLHLFVALQHTWFPTLDGPSHVNCARLMRECWGGNTLIQGYFDLNPYPEPNLLGHVIMAGTMLAAPAWLAEKVLVVLIIVGMAFGFFRTVRLWAPDNRWSPLLVMPFLLGTGLYMGFFNFSLGVPLMLLALERWERILRNRPERFPWSAVGVFQLLYLAHLSAFALGILLVTLRTALWLSGSGNARAAGLWVVVRALTILGIPLLLTCGYFVLHGGHSATPQRFPLAELFVWIVDGRGWISFSGDESSWTRVIACCLFTFAVIIGIRSIRHGATNENRFWLYSATLTIALYFILPDTLAGGSLTSPRLLFFAMLLLAVWIATSDVPAWSMAIGLTVITGAHAMHVAQLRATSSALAADVDELMSIADQLPPDAVVLPLNYGDNWMHSNISNYVGAARGAIILDNFVANAPFSPIRWRPERSPYAAIGDFSRSNRPCVRLNTYRDEQGPLITHILTWKLNDAIEDSCTKDLRRQLNAGFRFIAGSPTGDARLYMRR